MNYTTLPITNYKLHNNNNISVTILLFSIESHSTKNQEHCRKQKINQSWLCWEINWLTGLQTRNRLQEAAVFLMFRVRPIAALHKQSYNNK